MRSHILSVLVHNSTGVLTRVAGLFSRRGYNIDSLTVGMTQNEAVSRMTIVLRGDDVVLEQVKKQLNKLEDVINIMNLDQEDSVSRELVLIKVSAGEDERAKINEIVRIFRSKVIDLCQTTMTIELTGDEDKVEALIKLLEPYGIKEVSRTGITALNRGEETL